jgi:Rps23 Pro-64 3,4-dihydroxylase Tpa1-like proline 4-hydroxylase
MSTNFIKNEPSDVLGGAIAIYDNVWDDLEEDLKFLNSISFDTEESLFFTKAKVRSEDYSDDKNIKDIRTNFTISLTGASDVSDTIKNINDKFSRIMVKSLENYRGVFGISEPLVYSEPNSLLRYSDGQKFGLHYDGGSTSKRIISPILYLNDDYIGGEIEFINFGIKIKPKSGSLLVFPSNYAYRHVAHPVTSGTKYAIVTWIHDC